jgi:hypothetical protein
MTSAVKMSAHQLRALLAFPPDIARPNFRLLAILDTDVGRCRGASAREVPSGFLNDRVGGILGAL